MRFISKLNYETHSLLKRFYSSSKNHETRQKAQCILLSSEGFKIKQLVLIFDVHLNTIYNWMDGWNKDGILSIYHKKGQGRKPLLENIPQNEIKDLVTENPKQLNNVISEIENNYGIHLSKRTVIRYTLNPQVNT